MPTQVGPDPDMAKAEAAIKSGANAPQPVQRAPEAVLVGDIYNAAGKDAALEVARRFMVGTWTYTGQHCFLRGETTWVRWQVKSDGTIARYVALATDDDWGVPTTDKWKVTTAKYSDTGERYYAFYIGDDFRHAIIKRDGTVEYRLANAGLIMEKRDQLPFSK